MIGNIISAVIVLAVFIGMYFAVSYMREKKMGDGSGGCSGNCGSCSMRAAHCADKKEE